MNRVRVIGPLALIASLALVACGGGSSDTTSTPTTTTTTTTTTSTAGGGSAGGDEGQAGATSTVKIEADPTELAYTTSHLRTPQGSVTIEFNNPSSTSHNVVIEEADGRELASTDTISSGTATAKVSLVPGTYTYFCSVDGHEAAGMKGTLSVTEPGVG
jgi:plastocyanin